MNPLGSVLRIVLVAVMVATAHAADQPPDVMIRSVTDEVLKIVRDDRAILSGDAVRAAELVERKVLPRFDFQRMTALAVGRDWRVATPAQRERLVELFRSLLVRTYSNALTQYKDQPIEFRPLRGGAADSDVRVHADIRQPGAAPIALDFRLEKAAEGWKVYDIAVAGVSLVTNYRGSFSQEIQRRGVDGLIRSLEDKNRQLAIDRASF
jgi:phospholipid transport system substrate-binding protein